MTFEERCVRARVAAKNGEFGRAKDILRELMPRTQRDEEDLERAWARIEQLEYPS